MLELAGFSLEMHSALMAKFPGWKRGEEFPFSRHGSEKPQLSFIAAGFRKESGSSLEKVENENHPHGPCSPNRKKHRGDRAFL